MTSDTPAPAQEAHVEALAAWLIEHRDRDYPASVYKFTPDKMATDLLASDWLAAFVAERQAEALREAADEWPGWWKFPIWLRERADRIGGASC